MSGRNFILTVQDQPLSRLFCLLVLAGFELGLLGSDGTKINCFFEEMFLGNFFVALSSGHDC